MLQEAKPQKVRREDLDSGQFPDCWEYGITPDVETVVELKTGFVLKATLETRVGDWRLRAVSGTLYVEYWSGTAWIEQGKFEA